MSMLAAFGLLWRLLVRFGSWWVNGSEPVRQEPEREPRCVGCGAESPWSVLCDECEIEDFLRADDEYRRRLDV